MTITWLGQSGYLLEDSGTRVFLDPYLSDAVNRVAGRPRMVEPPIRPEEVSGTVICTHDHLDHLDPDAICRMDRAHIDFCAPSSCRKHLEELGCPRIRTLDLGDTITVGDFALTAVFADTLWNPRLEEMAAVKPEFLFICINGKLGNMNAEEAVRLTEVLEPKAAIPTHYGMFASNTEDPEAYTSRVRHGYIMELGRPVTPEEILAAVR